MPVYCVSIECRIKSGKNRRTCRNTEYTQRERCKKGDKIVQQFLSKNACIEISHFQRHTPRVSRTRLTIAFDIVCLARIFWCVDEKD